MAVARPELGPGAVAAGHPRVCEAALRTLDEGGNAFDAAVAAGFAACVCEPALTSLGGGGFLLARPVGGPAVLYDFFVDTPGRGRHGGALEPHFLPVTVRFPAAEQVFNVGRGSVAVPGILRGLLHVHARRGRLPLAVVLAPAVEAAREGVALNDHQATFLGLLEPILTLTPEGRTLYAARGRLPAAGERFANPDLAAFLEALPAGGDRDFYEGALASGIASDMRAGGGLVTGADLAAYRVIEREPLAVRFRDRLLLTNPPPSFGGGLLALSLERLGRRPPERDPVAAARSLVAVMREVDALRARGVLRPGTEPGPSAPPVPRFSRGTTHVSVVDAEGHAASMTTSNGEGSGVVVQGTGILLNNMLGEDDLHPDGFHAAPPGERVASMMSPSLLLRDDALELVVGSGGSKRIRTALLQVIRHVVDAGHPVAEAVARPRLHWDGETLQVEPGLGDAVEAALAGLGPVNRWPARDLYFGGVHALAAGGGGAGDPRRGGAFASRAPRRSARIGPAAGRARGE